MIGLDVGGGLAVSSAGAVTLTAQVLHHHINPYYVPDKITENLHTARMSFATSADGVLSALCIMHEE